MKMRWAALYLSMCVAGLAVGAWIAKTSAAAARAEEAARNIPVVLLPEKPDPICWALPAPHGSEMSFMEMVADRWPPVVCGGGDLGTDFRCYPLEPIHDPERCSIDPDHWVKRLRP